MTLTVSLLALATYRSRPSAFEGEVARVQPRLNLRRLPPGLDVDHRDRAGWHNSAWVDQDVGPGRPGRRLAGLGSAAAPVDVRRPTVRGDRRVERRNADRELLLQFPREQVHQGQGVIHRQADRRPPPVRRQADPARVRRPVPRGPRRVNVRPHLAAPANSAAGARCNLGFEQPVRCVGDVHARAVAADRDPVHRPAAGGIPQGAAALSTTRRRAPSARGLP